jgi:hypothetical protein
MSLKCLDPYAKDSSSCGQVREGGQAGMFVLVEGSLWGVGRL